jgi:S1-C subfamily serine protease
MKHARVNGRIITRMPKARCRISLRTPLRFRWHAVSLLTAVILSEAIGGRLASGADQADGRRDVSDEQSQPTIQEALKGVAILRVVQDTSELLVCAPVISAGGVLATNYHVVEDGREILVRLYDDREGRWDAEHEYEADVVRVSPSHDFALLEIPVKTVHFLRLASPERIRVGDEVFAVGSPHGLQLSLSRGIVGGFRTTEELQFTEQWLQRGTGEDAPSRVVWIQTDAAMNPGSSGGPLLNRAYELVGLASFSREGTGLNFALHSQHIRELAGHYYTESRPSKR